MKKSNTKKKVIIAVVIILVIIIGAIAYMTISDLQQEEKLNTELSEIADLANNDISNINIDQINKRLDSVVTTGDYATVEKAIKSYLKDAFNSMFQIVNILNDENFTKLLTTDNYKEDGKEFVKSKQYIADTIKKLEDYKEDYSKYFNKDKAMSYIEGKGLDSYYTDLYENEYLGDISSIDTQELNDSVDELISILNLSDDVLNLLSDNQESWTVENDNIVFSNENILNEYNNLIEVLKENTSEITINL